jgi:hypothetical protein
MHDVTAIAPVLSGLARWSAATLPSTGPFPLCFTHDRSAPRPIDATSGIKDQRMPRGLHKRLVRRMQANSLALLRLELIDPRPLQRAAGRLVLGDILGEVVASDQVAPHETGAVRTLLLQTPSPGQQPVARANS